MKWKKHLKFSVRNNTTNEVFYCINLLIDAGYTPSVQTVVNGLSDMGYENVEASIFVVRSTSQEGVIIEDCPTYTDDVVVMATTSSESRHQISYRSLSMMAGLSSYSCLSMMGGLIASLAIYTPLATKLIESTCPSPVCEQLINGIPLAVLSCGSLFLDPRKQGILQAAALSSAPVYLLYTGISLTKASIFNNKAICAAAIGASMLMGYVFHKHENSDEELVHAAKG